MATIYEIVDPTPIENAIVRRVLFDGIHRIYDIGAVDGYVLHDKSFDYEDEFGNVIFGYAAGTVSVRWDYDFDVNPRELYAVLASTVPADQIFGIVPGGGAEVV